MSSVTSLPRVTHNNAHDLIKATAKDSSRVYITDHCEDKMIERGVTRAQVMRCLQRGAEIFIEFDNEHMNYKVTLGIRSAGVQVQVVAALEEEAEGGLVIAVTTFIKEL